MPGSNEHVKWASFKGEKRKQGDKKPGFTMCHLVYCFSSSRGLCYNCLKMLQICFLFCISTTPPMSLLVEAYGTYGVMEGERKWEGAKHGVLASR